ncbi:DUF4139 domain-containing protein [Sphingorhabdus arenilitoris]|uniref:DUF4139 domain-containing protein n=1 Tax=Sphingorhabdus arenilitoris TaxID=1490041 RepID=A0ABV8RIC6_9SPHN
MRFVFALAGSLTALYAALPAAVQAKGPALVTSDGPASVIMTVYRDPYRGEQVINSNWPGGYALITETRTIQIPAGESVIRFEGVSEGMYPESAIVTGLPEGVKEKNRDARLLSPAGLIDAYLKREVELTRTNKATGISRKQNAMITAGPGGGVILETGEGFEALRCTGLPEKLNFARVPKDLAAKPTLSVITQSSKAVNATVTLSYMAAGFDWQANYVLNAGDIAADHKLDMNVFAWLTVANGGNQSFDQASLQVVAGKLNKERNAALPAGPDPFLRLQCWPMQRTDQVPFRQPYGTFTNPSFVEYEDAAAESIIVTASRMKGAPMEMAMAPAPPPPPPAPAIVAQQEELGDLKLYRVPEPMDVKAKGQKQVAMIVQPEAEFKLIYRVKRETLYGGNNYIPVLPTLISKNDEEKGLGVPLPSGQGMVFENAMSAYLLAGEVKVADRAVGDKIEWVMPASNQVKLLHLITANDANGYDISLKLTNANPFDIEAEIELPEGIGRLPDNVRRVDGKNIWFVTLPGNDEMNLAYRISFKR